MLTIFSRAKNQIMDDTSQDAMLVQAARRDSAAFVILYRRYVTPIYRYLYSRTSNQADAEDLTSQVFTEALAGLNGYREEGNFAAWLFTIARRRLTDHYRRQRPEASLAWAENEPGDELPPLVQVAQNEQLAHLDVLVSRLDEEKQELLRLRFAAELTYAEIGHLVGRSEAATKMAIRRLLRQLEQNWEADNE